MRFLFVSAPMPGHLDWGGYLRTAAELARRGHTVTWASGTAVAQQVAAAGVPFHALRETGWRWPPPPPLQLAPDTDPALARRLRGERALDQWLDEPRVATATQELLDLAHTFRPDLVVSEVFVSAAGLVAEALGVPFAVAGWPALPPNAAAGDPALVELARGRLARLLDQFGLQGNNWTDKGAPALQSPHLHLTYWSERWYAGRELLSQTVHVGGQAAPPAEPPAWPDGDPWVLITLGTSFGNDPHFFVNAARAAAELGCLPIVALAGQLTAAQVAALRPSLPATTVVVDRVDFGGVLPKLAAAVHHGGAGVTHALVTHAVPQIVVPHAADQMHQAQGVVRSGIGLHVAAKEATVERITVALAQQLPDLSVWRTNAETLRDEFTSLGGVGRAADLLANVVQ